MSMELAKIEQLYDRLKKEAQKLALAYLHAPPEQRKEAYTKFQKIEKRVDIIGRRWAKKIVED